MSILGQAAAGEAAGYIVLTVLTLAGLAVGWRLGLFRKTGVLGPDRVEDVVGAWRVLVMLMLGTSAWLGIQIGFATFKQVRWAAAGHEGRFQLTDLTPGDYAFLATVPGVVAVAVVLACMAFFPAGQRPKLGIEPAKFPYGVVRGIAGILMIMPLILWVGEVTEWIYQAVQFKHPSAHDLLRAMKESGQPALEWLLVIGAVLIAPVVEEFLFRGLFQTLLVWAFNHRAWAKPRRQGFPVIATDEAAVPPAEPPPAPPTPGRLALGRWLAILVTSAIFAGIHEKWSVPPIFVLSLCLGLAYERTGSLWVPMSIHALFNGLQTLFYLTVVAK